MSLLTAGIADALTDALATAGQEFDWQGVPYRCVVNAEQATLVTSKSLFAANGYPQPGDVINLAGKRRQITTIANATDVFVAGGINSDVQFVDDPANPALAIQFTRFIGM